MLMRNFCTAGISFAILAIFTEGALIQRSLEKALASFQAGAPSWLALGAVAGLALAIRLPRRN
ncbi:hypothetical protein OKA05_07530 [Luteolibacter arcticus]|uniref:Uncharacterized protein n=1 Tax=Luteolibacter arcticus TaxID=1581411 RepID=A0ABT3GGG1_9BACT|nr:hypothetical protein [Luteolibacter arcticus]MCW1922400.1 hypothetical protein [Luteolibacter arcticus]